MKLKFALLKGIWEIVEPIRIKGQEKLNNDLHLKVCIFQVLSIAGSKREKLKKVLFCLN